MYCKYCYKMIDDGAQFCPACGKSQNEKPANKVARILLGIVVWFVSMVVIAIIGTAMNLASAGGLLSGIYTVTIAVIPVLLAFKIAYPKKIKTNATARPMPDGNAPPIPKSTDVKETFRTTEAKANQAEVDLIVQSLRQGTFEETIQELYGESESEDAPIASAQVVSETANLQPVSESDTKPVVGATHKVTGISHYMDNIMKLAHENSDYDMSKKEIVDSGMIDERIWKYSFYPSKTELVPEPDNPTDPKAIKVIVDNRHVGYIKSGSCSRVLKLINENRIHGIDCTIGGGPYKIVYEDYDSEEDRDIYELERDQTNYFVHLTVYETKN